MDFTHRELIIILNEVQSTIFDEEIYEADELSAYKSIEGKIAKELAIEL